jgi:hypothetical protein
MCLLKSITIPLLLTVFLIIPKPSFAGWLEFGAGCPAGSEPLTGHNITLDEFISFDVELSGLQSDTVSHEGTNYLRCRVPGVACCYLLYSWSGRIRPYSGLFSRLHECD